MSPTPPLESLLIANRGEIALRIIRACKEMGVRSIAVYSDADRASPHVLAADEAYRIGPAPAAESYLDVERILGAARRADAAAIHPGYGFLAERAAFARAVEADGRIFVGPTPETIAAMGDKTEARRRMRAAGVPIVPGLVDPVADAAAARTAAEEIGFPVLLKAAAGGGGKGMRVVGHPDEVERAFEAAAREALGAFGDGSIYIERYLDAPRHIEIQVLGDGRGRVIHLGERECSIQRRHQKLLEEAPSPVLTPEQRAAMGEAAVRAAEAVSYRGAGTLEFLWKDGEFYFLEMNTRIQVEHPVTEFVTGVDLVEWQLRIAGGEPLRLTQDDIQLRGHAIECRITAEDVASGFLPSSGRITGLSLPAGPGVRWDGGIAAGQEVGLHYDSLLGKLIVHGETRAAATSRMARALHELEITGLDTSVPFHLALLRDAEFAAGATDIRFLERHPELTGGEPDEGAARAAAVLAVLLEAEARAAGRPGSGARADRLPDASFTAWQRAGWGWAR